MANTKRRGKNGQHGRDSNGGGRNGSECVIFADGSNQDYGLVTKTLGDGRFMIKANRTGECIMGIMRGVMRRRSWISVGAVVIFAVRSYQDSKVDILHVYTDRDVTQLQKTHALSAQFQASLFGQSSSYCEDEGAGAGAPNHEIFFTE
jgi:translation initiation factor 1A